jgi:hypothetical protein
MVTSISKYLQAGTAPAPDQRPAAAPAVLPAEPWPLFGAARFFAIKALPWFEE